MSVRLSFISNVPENGYYCHQIWCKYAVCKCIHMKFVVSLFVEFKETPKTELHLLFSQNTLACRCGVNSNMG